MEASEAQRRAFGEALGQQLEGVENQASFATLVADKAGESVSASAVQQWLAGKTEPTRRKVIAMEQVLGLTPGTLARHLGWLPLNAVLPPGDLMAAINADPLLDQRGRRVLRSLYQSLIEG